MKTSHVITALVLVTGFTSLSFAGPGIDYWNRMAQVARDRAAIEAQAGVPTKIEAAATVASCATCSCPGMKKS
jgi:hypothetical protein